MQHIDVEALRPRPGAWDRFEIPTLPERPDTIWLGNFQRMTRERFPLRCIVSIDLGESDGIGNWLHISIGRINRLPTWPDICTTRDELGYANRVFVQVIPPNWRAEPNIVHLFHRLDALTVPLEITACVAGRHAGKHEEKK